MADTNREFLSRSLEPDKGTVTVLVTALRKN